MDQGSSAPGGHRERFRGPSAGVKAVGGPLAVAVLGRGVVDPDTPIIHADDRGLLRGLAAFETLRVYGGRPFAMSEHLERLAQSASRMHLQVPDLDALGRLAQEAIEASGRPDCTLRLTVTGGREGGQPVALAIIGALPTHLDDLRAVGIGVISLCLGTDPRARQNAPWLLTGVKSTSYAVNMAAHEEAERRGAGDAIFLAADGTVLEGPTTNVWWRRGQTLLTPALDLGILAGVTRAWVLRLAREAGYDTEEGWYPLSDLASADEAFTSSSVRELMPIVALDEQAISDGQPGEAVRTLHAALRLAAGA
jgi:4-amino-4-deoxychorismate lyase